MQRAGVADAATGGNFLLGTANTETSTAVLTNTAGIPLSLHAARGRQPFSVNNSVQVHRLNAQYVGGKSAGQLQSQGGVGMTSPPVKIKLPVGATTNVVSTGALPAGTYYVTATALLYAGGTNTVYCRILSAPTVWGGGGGAGYIQAAETAVVTVPANTVLTEACYSYAAGQFVNSSAITAIRIDSSSTGRSLVRLFP